MLIKKMKIFFYKFFCCACTSCILWDEIQIGLVDNSNFEERKKELQERFT